MISNTDSNRQIALLIDAENVSPKYIKYILDELSKYGTPTFKRIYGDWSSAGMKQWKDMQLTYSIKPVQQLSYTNGKNASDSLLIIDAMDILYTSNVDGFCIVSSDSDFTGLATRLREAGKLVIGMGEKKTPKALISACEKFIYLEVLIPHKKPQKPVKKTATSSKSKSTSSSTKAKEEVQIVHETQLGEDIYAIAEQIKQIINEIGNDDGVASLADVGNNLSKRFPEFDARNYGFTKFSQFMNSLKCIEVITERPNGRAGVVYMYVKVKE